MKQDFAGSNPVGRPDFPWIVKVVLVECSDAKQDVIQDVIQAVL